jgi:hypothetical protein
VWRGRIEGGLLSSQAGEDGAVDFFTFLYGHRFVGAADVYADESGFQRVQVADRDL